MNQHTAKRILLIDDDEGSNLISKLFFRKIAPSSHIISFTDPQQGLDYIAGSYAAGPVATVLLLDINMPVLSGWDVLEQLAGMPAAIRQHLTIYVLSSSINSCDKERSAASLLVSGYIEKPLSFDVIKKILA